MIAHDLNPADFVISKDRAMPSSVIPLVGPFFYDYTVFVGDESFTVTEPNDTRFLQYFYQRIIAPEQDAPTPEHKRASVISPFDPVDGPADLTACVGLRRRSSGTALSRYSPHAAKASLKARSPGEPFSMAMRARRWLV
jgi:hypothetical protein